VSGGRPVIPDRRTAQLAGVLMVCGGAYLLYDAYEARGRQRPFWTRLLPG
jgi:uncharacterized membrane protein HdeD (DUF308 family)